MSAWPLLFVGRWWCADGGVVLLALSLCSMIVTDSGVVELMNTSDGSFVVCVVVRGVPDEKNKAKNGILDSFLIWNRRFSFEISESKR